MFHYNNVFSYILVCWSISTMKSASRKSTGAAPTAPSTPDSTRVVRTTCRVAGWFNLGTKWINFKWRLTLEKPANENYTAQLETIHDFQGINIDKCYRELFGWPHYKIMFRCGKNTKTSGPQSARWFWDTFLSSCVVSPVYTIYHWNWTFILYLIWLVIPYL